MKYSMSITKEVRHYKDHDSEKYWCWDGMDTSMSSRSEVIVKTGEEKVKELIQLANEKGYELGDFRLEFTKVLNKDTRKDVVFDLNRKYR